MKQVVFVLGFLFVAGLLFVGCTAAGQVMATTLGQNVGSALAERDRAEASCSHDGDCVEQEQTAVQVNVFAAGNSIEQGEVSENETRKDTGEHGRPSKPGFFELLYRNEPFWNVFPLLALVLLGWAYLMKG